MFLQTTPPRESPRGTPETLTQRPDKCSQFSAALHEDRAESSPLVGPSMLLLPSQPVLFPFFKKFTKLSETPVLVPPLSANSVSLLEVTALTTRCQATASEY